MSLANKHGDKFPCPCDECQAWYARIRARVAAAKDRGQRQRDPIPFGTTEATSHDAYWADRRQRAQARLDRRQSTEYNEED